MKQILFHIALILSSICLNAQTQPRLVLPIGHTSWIRSAVFSPDGKGPIYSIYSFIPGLGKKQITKNSEKGHVVSFSRKQNLFFGTSITLGIIGVTSKFLSNYYYSQYTNDFANPNYKIANISQKVFLGCLTAFSVMFIYDFSTTLALGIGNKILQRKINKKIRKLENLIILN
jgi:hypothetical protein